MLWSWNETDDENWTHGTFNTKDEAIQDAIGCRKWIEKSLSTDNPTIYIGECELVPLRTNPDPDRIMEELDQVYCDDSGCDTYIYDGVTDEERKWLEDKLSELMFEFHQKIRLNPGWFKVVSMEKVNLNEYQGAVQMKDFLNNEIKIGDKVVAMRHRGTSSFLYKGEVIGFKGQFVIIGKIEDVESEWGLHDEMKVSSYKVVVINDIVLKS